MKVAFLLLSFFFLSAVHAQFSTISTSYLVVEQPVFQRMMDGNTVCLTTGERKTASPNFRNYQTTVTLRSFDKNFSPLAQRTLDATAYPVNRSLAQLVRSGDDCWFVYWPMSDYKNVGDFKVAKVNTTTLDLEEPKMIASKDDIDEKIGTFSDPADVHVRIQSSPSFNYHLLMVTTAHNKIFLACLNEKMELLWKKKTEIPQWKTEYLNSFTIDDEGRSFFGFQHDDKASLAFFDRNGNLTQKELSFPEKPIDIQVYASKKWGLVLTGFYGANYYGKGVYRANLNMTSMEPVNWSQTAFPDSLVQRLKKDGLATLKSNHYGVWKFEYANAVAEKEDGSLSLITEINGHLGAGNITATAVGSLLVSQWTLNKAPGFLQIPRYIVSRGRNPKEYFVLPGKKDLFLFYWDDASNLNKSLAEDQKVLSNPAFVGATIQADNSVQRIRVTNDAILTGLKMAYRPE